MSKKRKPPSVLVERKMVVRILAIGPFGERGPVADRLEEAGYRIVERGPYTNKVMFPRVDPTRFRMVAEREENTTLEPTWEQVEARCSDAGG